MPSDYHDNHHNVSERTEYTISSYTVYCCNNANMRIVDWWETYYRLQWERALSNVISDFARVNIEIALKRKYLNWNYSNWIASNSTLLSTHIPSCKWNKHRVQHSTDVGFQPNPNTAVLLMFYKDNCEYMGQIIYACGRYSGRFLFTTTIIIIKVYYCEIIESPLENWLWLIENIKIFL